MHDSSRREASLKDGIARAFANKGLQIPSVFFYETVDSTNTRAKLFAESGKNAGSTPAIFFSRAQSAGRGTRERTFESPRDAGVYISFLIYPNAPADEVLRLTTLAAVAACRATERISDGRLSPKIKWVNDLTVNDRKLAGILTEGRLTPEGTCEHAIVGVGINLRPAPHSDGVAAVMTTLEDEGVHCSAEELAIALSLEFFSALSEPQDGVRAEYAARSSLIGRRVTVSGTAGLTEARVTGIDRDLALLCEDERGCALRFISGDVSVHTV